ncbi:T9SS type A sorting domain-containing protein [Rhodocytophaga aerolata]|uniref:T9SS type A sorting domain-containing protein n=1 Tax=Rhodocytophaga aerolata TaxID=455078 RepID=A0ABT8R418_9BACT|nr:T9SS type A sorting domain-containing protein [Rhodocytophaga aerolata]MDO1446842.1 T9SS type A sorting domain-containing protein [Rhodocytophaga aerolata]
MIKIYQNLIHTQPTIQKYIFVAMCIGMLLLLSSVGFGQSTYRWQGGNNPWTTGNRWNPNRNTPAANDILIIENGGTVTLTSVPSETIGQIIVRNNTYVILQAGAAGNTLTVGGNVIGDDLIVEAGSTLEINTNNALNIRLSALATASISGDVILSGTSNAATHTLDATDIGAIIFNTGSVFTQNNVGNPFTTTGANEAVVFASGSTFVSLNGANPFGKPLPNSKVKFNTGSLFSYRQTSSEPTLSGRTYADFEINAPGYTQTSIGSNGFTADNFTVTNVSTMNIQLTGGINIKGNLTVNSGIVNFSPGSANTVTFGGLSNQVIQGSGGTLTFGTNTTVSVPGMVTLRRDIFMNGPVTVNGTLSYDNTIARTLTITGSLTGLGTVDMSSGNQAHILNLGGAVNTIAAITTSSLCNSTINYNSTGNQLVSGGINYNNLTFSGGGIKTLLGNITVCNTLLINSGPTLSLGGFNATVSGTSVISGILDAGLTAVNGTGSFTLTSTGTLFTASPDGINAGTSLGSIRVNGSRNLTSGSFIYNGTLPQVTGNGLPASVLNLTINNTAATPMVSLSQSVTVSDLATFTAGSLSIGSNTLTLNGRTTIGTGTITGGTTSNLSIGGNNTPVLTLPTINNGLLNFDVNKTGSNASINLPASPVTIYHAGTLRLVSGSITNGANIIMGENSAAITNIIRTQGSLTGTPTFNNLVNVTYTQTVTTGPELPTSATALNNLTVGIDGFVGLVVTLNADVVVNGVFSMTTNSANTGTSLNGRVLTLNGGYNCSQANNAVFIGSPTSSLIIKGDNKSVSGTIRFSQSSGSSRSLQNFTLNRTGSGSAFTISTYAEINNATIASGTLTATGTDIAITNATIESNGKFINNSTAFPAIIPLSTTVRAFNNSTLGTALVNKFDRYAASNDIGNAVASATTDLAFIRNGAGSIYAFRNKILNPLPNTAVIRFQLGVTSTIANTSAAGTLMIGKNLGDDAGKPTATARLQFNLTTANNRISVTSPDGTAYTSADNLNLGQVFTWVINNSGSTILYTGQNGTEYSLATGRCELWHGTSRLASNLAIQDPGQVMEQLKFVMDAGSGTINLRNLQINPLATITTASVCYTAGYVFNVNYSVNSIPGAATPPSASFNEGNEFRVQLSNSSGNFDPNNNVDILGKITSTSATGSIPVTIPLYATGSGYRYRVISSNLNISVGATNGVSMYFITPGNVQSMIKTTSGSTLTASSASAYKWGYRTTSATGVIYDLPNTTNTYLPKGMDFKGLDNLQPSGTPGTYYVVCQMRVSCGGVDTWVVSNEVTVYVNCDTGLNLAINGNFNNTNTTGFASEYTRVYDNPSVQSEMYPEGTYAIGDNPRAFHTGFCNMNTVASRSPVSGGNMLIANAANTSQKLWTQTLNLKPSTDYVLTFYAASLAGTGSSLLFGLYVNCYRVGDDITGNYTGNCVWQKYSIQMRTGVNPNNPTDLTTTFAHEISIVNIAATASGNDVAIDDIEFFECAGAGGSAYFQPLTQYKWRGYTTDWFNSVNWGACYPNVPTCGDDVVIPGNLINYPIINGKNNGIDAFARNVTVHPGATLKINNNNTSTVNLNICGDLTLNDGDITTSDPSKATLTFTSPYATVQKIAGTFALDLPSVIVNQTNAARPGVELATDVSINSLLDIVNSNSLAIRNHTLTLKGTLSTSTGTLTGSSASRLVINGTGNLGGSLRFTSGNRTLSRLTMNRTSSGQATLGTDLTLVGGSNALLLTNGIITTTTANVLILNESSGVSGSSAYVSGGSDASYINGPVTKIVNSTNHFTFPTGKNGRLAEIGIQPSSSSTTRFRAEYMRQNPTTPYPFSKQGTNLVRISLVEYWMMDRVSGSSNAKVTLFWDAFSDVSSDPSQWNQLRVAHYQGGKWDSEGPGSGATMQPGFSFYYGYLTSDNISSFSPFTWGSLNDFNPLPVELVDLKAVASKEVVNVNWFTSTEHNSSHFILQRSADGVNFVSLTTLKAAGESKSVQTYTYVDRKPLSGTNYYRLLMVDKDDSKTTSKIVSAEITKTTQAAIDIYPNPSDGKHIFIQMGYTGEVVVSVFTMTGAEVITQRAISDGNIVTIQPRNGLAPGMYIVRVATSQGSYQQKLIVK